MPRRFLPLVILALAAVPCGARADIIWANWTSNPNGGATTATITGVGTATLTPQGPNTTTVDFGAFRFDNATISPTNLSTVGWVRGQNPNAVWGYTLDLGGFATSDGLIVGVGNFGHIPGDPQWQLSAFDTANAPVPLSTLTQLGSFDHTWVNFNEQFNDDLTLDTATGLFSIATVPGLNDINSDIMLFRLPAGVSRIQVSSTAPYLNEDTHNVLLGATAPAAVPEPASLVVFAGVLLAGGALARRRFAR